VVRALGAPQGSGLQLWFWALTHNSVVDFTSGSPYLLVALHFCFGIAWAVVYAAWAEPRLTGPSWRRGLVFCLLPWVASLVVFLPLVGGGPLGLALGAGPLPIVGNLVLHLVYGGVLGELYSRAGRSSLAELEELPEELVAQVASMMRAERGAAIGLGGGTALGLLIGVLIGSVYSPQLVPTMGMAMPLACAIVGAALGALIGSLVGTYLFSAETDTARGTTTRR
jgi:uncharacterized membrane protein YagU involved in acid resistance